MHEAPKERSLRQGRAVRLIGGAASVALGAGLLALGPAGMAWAGPPTGPTGPTGPTSNCGSPTLSLEALLATDGTPEVQSGSTVTVYYEDGTPFNKAALSLENMGTHTTTSLSLTEKLLYSAVKEGSTVPKGEVTFLTGLAPLKYPAQYSGCGAGSPPNAADPLPEQGNPPHPGEQQEIAPYVEELTFTVPNLSSGNYNLTLTAYDSDGNYEPYSWSFSVEKSTVPVGAVGGVGVAAVLGGGLLLVQGTRRRRRPAASA